MNNENQNKESVSRTVIDKIKKEGLKMHSKIYFISKAVIFAFIIVCFILLLLYFASFAIFSMRASGTLFMPRFGLPGIKIFLSSLPLIPILIVIILVALLEIFTKRFNFIYRRPIIYSLLAISIIAVTGGFLLEKTPFHSNLLQKSQRENFFGMRDFYRDFSVSPRKNSRFGIVLSAVENGFIIQTPAGATTTIITNNETIFKTKENIKEGDVVIVLGKPKNGSIEAVEIDIVKEKFNFFPPFPFRDNIRQFPAR